MPTCRCSTTPDTAFSSLAATTSSPSAPSCARSATSRRGRLRSIPCSLSSGREKEAISSFSTPAATTPSPAPASAARARTRSRRQASRILHHLRDAARQRRVRRKRPQQPLRHGAARTSGDAGRRHLQHDDRGPQRRLRRDRRTADSRRRVAFDQAVLFRRRRCGRGDARDAALAPCRKGPRSEPAASLSRPLPRRTSRR